MELVRSSDDPQSCWSTVLEITGQSSSGSFATLDFPADVASLVAQLDVVLAAEPIPSETTFLWFGLFDLLVGDQEAEGYYVSGGTGANPGADMERIYWPEGRYLKSSVLDRIKAKIVQIRNESALAKTELPHEYDVLEYAVLFGAAALLTKFTVRALGIRLPVYVGVDSGDWALIANTPPDADGMRWPIMPARVV
ncbi:MAG: hypothetical protein LAP86_13305 [Acidobacteriia bacterium]|nr:hypothetical protein [Terriglobia bacterium]